MKTNVESFNLTHMSSSGYLPLSYQVAESLHHYFNYLDGAIPVNLYDLILAEMEIPLLKIVLAKCKGNESKTAKLLGVSRGTLRKKIK
jgi:Fis family transcriptional regulator